MPITKATASSIAPAAKGDLVVGSATNDAAVLGVGSNDQVLTADSSTATGLKWATPAAGGMTLISTTTLTGSSVTLSSIPSTYNNLQLIIRDILPSTDEAYLSLRLNGDTNARYKSRDIGGLGGSNLTFNDTSLTNLAIFVDNAVTQNLQIINFYDYANTVTWKYGTSDSIAVDAGTNTAFRHDNNSLYYNQTAAISSITIFFASGNITSGTALLYGVK